MCPRNCEVIFINSGSRSNGNGGESCGGGTGDGMVKPPCDRSVNGTPSPGVAARVTRAAAIGAAAGGYAAGGLAGAAVGYGAVAGVAAAGLFPKSFLDPRNAAAGNRLYGAIAAGLGLSRNLSLRISGFIEKYGPRSNDPYSSDNGNPTDPANRSNGTTNGKVNGRLGNSVPATTQIDQGRVCAR